MTDPNPFRTPREMCVACLKPRSVCVCSSIVPVDNRTRVFVLQHPRERTHSIGTVRFIELGLSNSEVVVASGPVDLLTPMPLPASTALLFPREGALDLETVAEAARPDHLLLLDGTWSQARKLYRTNPWLHALPHYVLSPSGPSRYRIRRSPHPDYVSTLEAALLALNILEPETSGTAALLAAFDAMIDTQIRCRELRSAPTSPPPAPRRM